MALNTTIQVRRCRRGGRAPNLKKKTTVTAALHTTGPCALGLADGARNSTRFRNYVSETLIPVLQPGDIVIMDSLPARTPVIWKPVKLG